VEDTDGNDLFEEYTLHLAEERQKTNDKETLCLCSATF